MSGNTLPAREEPQVTPTAGPDRKPHEPDSQHPVAGAASHTDSRPGPKTTRTRLTTPPRGSSKPHRQPARTESPTDPTHGARPAKSRRSHRQPAPIENHTNPTHNTPSREPQATPTAGPDRKPHGSDSRRPVAGAASHTDSRPGPKGSSRATAEHPPTARTAPPRISHPHTLGGSRLRTCADRSRTRSLMLGCRSGLTCRAGLQQEPTVEDRRWPSPTRARPTETGE